MCGPDSGESWRQRAAGRVVSLFLACMLLIFSGCGSSDSPPGSVDTRLVVVTTLEDAADPGDEITLRAALELVADGGTIVFDPALNGGTIELSIIGEPHSILRGEVFSSPAEGMQFLGYGERDYGPSALYARKNLTIDASAMPDGIHLHWSGGVQNPARVLAVYGSLTLRNLTISGGYAAALPLDDAAQPFTLARGAGLAVWGKAVLQNCTIGGNAAFGDPNPSRDRGAFGGGIYADLLELEDSIVSGNAVRGFGAAGGGVYSVGGAGFATGGTSLSRSTLSGNRVEGQHAYGGGIYSDGGGPGNNRTLRLENCTVARNLVADHPEIAEDARFQYYYRGGGIYMSNGFLTLIGCTVAENAVSGPEAVFNNRPNVGGGGIAATIGNAHVVENLNLRHSLVVGNTLNDDPEDIFSGSLIHFVSQGYNLIGRLDLSQILVPMPEAYSLSRKHWPKQGDLWDIRAAEVLLIDEAVHHPDILSMGVDADEYALLLYPVQGEARDAIPASSYTLSHVLGEYCVLSGGEDDFLHHVLEKLRTQYVDELGANFGSDLEELADADFYGPAVTWPSNPDNVPWITFWRELEQEIGDRLGPAGLNDDFWGTFSSGLLGDYLWMTMVNSQQTISLSGLDQLGQSRPQGGGGDIGAVEMPVE